jgi:IPT/TIG domain-containing protein
MSRARTLLALLAIPAFLVAAAIPAVAKKATKSSAPVVKSISPMRLKIGETLTIRGSGFIPGKHKDTVVFMGAGKRVVWVKADKASRKTIKVKLPSKLAALLTSKNGTLQSTRLQIRVIAKKSGRAFTKRGKSPIVSPGLAGPGTGTTTSCGADPSSPSHDADNDFLSDQLETALHTNPCSADSDGDGIADGFEYQSALDLNRNANSSAIPWPYPGKRPYPNPLDSGDSNLDFDGDSLTLFEEYQASFAWAIGIDAGHKLQTFLPYAPNPNPNNNVMVVAYSDGVVNGSDQWGFIDVDEDGQYSGVTDIPSWINYSGQGFLTDEEKDIDGDGLTNFDETHGPLSGPSWWLKDSISKNDGTYPLPYAGTDWMNRDTDGDGLPDGSDDQDHDGYTNIEEDYGLYIAPRFTVFAATNSTVINVHAFNPCLPNVLSPACSRHPADLSYAPFKLSSRPETFASWPAP